MAKSNAFKVSCLIVLGFGLVAVEAPAAPLVSSTLGTFQQGESVTISGSSFGTKPYGVAPHKYDDFENGTDGALLTTTGYWNMSSNNPVEDKPQFSDDETRHIHSKLSGKFIEYGIQDMTYTPDLNFSGRKIYMDLWQRFQWASLTNQHQNKMFKIQSKVNDNGGSDPDAYPIMNFYCWRYNTGGTWCYIPLSNTEGSIVQNNMTCPGNTPAWYHWQIELQNNDIGSSNGEYRVWRNGSLLAEAYNLEIRLTGDNHFNCFWLGRYLGNYTGDLSNTLYYDEVYLDDSWARVEIGNAATWSACSHRETQIPSAWSSSSITAKVNQGSFADGAGAYLYVTDDEGSVNTSGYPITLGLVQYTLTVNNGSGSGDYDENDIVPISAGPAPSGKAFAAWMGDYTYVADRMASSTTVTMPATDVSVTAAYAWVYELTVNSGTGDGQYFAATVVDIEADPAPSGTEFADWTGDVGYLGDTESAATTVTMPSSAVEVTAGYASTAIPGDLNDDGWVGQPDLDIILDQWSCGQPPREPITDPRADANGDGWVGQPDLDIVLDHWGQSS